MRHYDEMQIQAQRIAAIESIVVGCILCFINIGLVLCHITIADDWELYSLLFLGLLGFYMMRCIQKDALYTVEDHHPTKGQYALVVVYMVIALCFFLLAIQSDIGIKSATIQEGTILLIKAVIVCAEGLGIAWHLHQLRKESL